MTECNVYPKLHLVSDDASEQGFVDVSSARQIVPLDGQQPSPEVQTLLNDLKAHLLAGKNNSFATGDIVTKLVEQHDYKISELAKMLDYSRTRLHELYLTAKATPPERRDESLCFSYFEIARKTADKFKVDLQECLNDVKEIGPASVRQVSRAMAQKQILRKNEEARKKGPLVVAKNVNLVNQCHQGSCIDVLRQHPEAKFDLIWADPPYVYDRVYGGNGVSRDQCSNSKPHDALQITIDVLANCGRHLKPNAPLLLCQAAGELKKEFLEAIDKYEWEIAIQLIWDKRRSAPGDNSCPYLPRTESIWVLKRKGDRLGRCDDKIHSDILEGFSPVLHYSTAAGETHMFQKPVELCEFFVKKHTRPGEVIADLFGCSGSMCIAAGMNDRNWVYIESHPDNFLWGSSRISDALAKPIGLAA